MAVQGVGALIGGPLSAPLMRRIGERWLCGIGLIGIVVGSLLLEGGSLVFVLLGAVAFGMALPPLLVGAYTLLQLRTPGELQGRAFSAFDLIASLPQTMSIALGAILITVLGYQGELTIIAVVVSIAAIVLLVPIAGEPNFGPLVPPRRTRRHRAHRDGHRSTQLGARADLVASRLRPARLYRWKNESTTFQNAHDRLSRI